MNQALHTQTEQALEYLKKAGFEYGQAATLEEEFNELNIVSNSVVLLRTVSKTNLSLVGIIDGRKASTSLPLPDQDALSQATRAMFESAKCSPQDPANALAAGQSHSHIDGPLEADKPTMVARLQELFEYRSANTTKANINEGILQHKRQKQTQATSEGSLLQTDMGWYEAMFLVVGTEGNKSSSMIYNEGTCYDLQKPLTHLFGTQGLLVDAENQIETIQFPNSFTGSVLLSPMTVTQLIAYLKTQLSDQTLLAKASVYADKVGKSIANQALNITHRAFAPGAAPYSSDGFLLKDFPIVKQGCLQTLLPTDYASRKRGFTHQPSGGCFRVEPGDTSKSELLSGIERGALVGRLSMGRPASNGDFSGVIKNSYSIENGQPGPALSETMISGNIAQMLQDIDGISAETIDYGMSQTPWIRIPNLVFS